TSLVAGGTAASWRRVYTRWSWCPRVKSASAPSAKTPAQTGICRHPARRAPLSIELPVGLFPAFRHVPEQATGDPWQRFARRSSAASARSPRRVGAGDKKEDPSVEEAGQQ